MPRKSTIKVTGVWERELGSKIWWIRYRVRGGGERSELACGGLEERLAGWTVGSRWLYR
jgi:hypothetical protein